MGSAEVRLKDGSTYTKYAKTIMDSKMVGISHNVFEGMNEDNTMMRRVGGDDQVVDCCEALIWYQWMYGAVDSFDQSIGAYPVDFRGNGAWVRRLFYWAIDASVHNAYTIMLFHTGVYDNDKKPFDRIQEAKICYCQEGSGVKGRKRRDGKHRCYFDRDGMSGRLKFMKDLSRALIIRADRELGGRMRPGKRGRKSTGPPVAAEAAAAAAACSAPAPAPKAPPVKRSKLRHGEGHHQYVEVGQRGRCVVCQFLHRSDPSHTVKCSTQGCKNCSRRKDVPVRVCEECWGSALGKAMHKVEFRPINCKEVPLWQLRSEPASP